MADFALSQNGLDGQLLTFEYVNKWHIANVQTLAAATDKEAPLLLWVESGGCVRDELSSTQLQSSARAVSGDHPAAAPRSVTSIIQPRRPATDGSQQQEIDNEPRKYKYSIYHTREYRGPGRSGFCNILKQDMHVHQTKYWNWITSTEDLEWIFLSFNIDFAKVRSLSVSMVQSVQHGMGGWHNACADIWGHGATI